MKFLKIRRGGGAKGLLDFSKKTSILGNTGTPKSGQKQCHQTVVTHKLWIICRQCPGNVRLFWAEVIQLSLVKLYHRDLLLNHE